MERYELNELDVEKECFIFWRTAPSLMIGNVQNLYQKINIDFAQMNNINIVRRITGGGTIYTDMNGWQFYFIVKGAKDEKTDFNKYTKPIIDALETIEIKAY